MTEEEQAAALCPLTVRDHDIGVSILIWKTANSSHPEMEITAPVVSNIVCFRYKPRTMLTEPELEKLNKMIYSNLNQTSFWMVSDTTIKGRYMLRAYNVNHRSRKQDFDFIVNQVKKNGEKSVFPNETIRRCQLHRQKFT